MTEVQPPGSARRGLRILLVDDHEDSRDIVCYLLENAGHEVTCATGGADAVDRLGVGGFDAAVVDLSLPDIDGYEVARAARAIAGPERLRLVAATGYTSSEHREAARLAGFDVYLVKPLEPSELLAAVTSAGA